MATFQINANGTDMGEYTASTVAEALDKYARDAGYTDYADVVNQFGGDATAIEIDVAALCESVTKKTGFPVFQDSYGNGVALVSGVSYATHQELAESIGKTYRDFAA